MRTKQTPLHRWQRAFPGASSVILFFTTLCCVGVSAATSLVAALGAGVLINDKYLSIRLVMAITITTVASSVTYQRHRNPLPLLLTMASGFWIYYFTFSDYHKSRVWLGLALLVAAQLYAVYRTTRACRAPRMTAPAETT
jgi:hypothetical protein